MEKGEARRRSRPSLRRRRSNVYDFNNKSSSPTQRNAADEKKSAARISPSPQERRRSSRSSMGHSDGGGGGGSSSRSSSLRRRSGSVVVGGDGSSSRSSSLRRRSGSVVVGSSAGLSGGGGGGGNLLRLQQRLKRSPSSSPKRKSRKSLTPDPPALRHVGLAVPRVKEEDEEDAARAQADMSARSNPKEGTTPKRIWSTATRVLSQIHIIRAFLDTTKKRKVFHMEREGDMRGGSGLGGGGAAGGGSGAVATIVPPGIRFAAEHANFSRNKYQKVDGHLVCGKMLFRDDYDAFKRAIRKKPKQRTLQDLLLLRDVVSNVQFFVGMPLDITLELCRELALESFERNDVVYHQGTTGSKFYIVCEGAVSVDVHRVSGFGYTACHLYGGESFGETAMGAIKASQRVRGETVIAIKPFTTLLVIEHNAHAHIHAMNEEAAREKMDFLTHSLVHRVFRTMSKADLHALSHALVHEEHQSGETLIEQGQPAELYFVRSGFCRVVKTVRQVAVELAELKTGEFVGSCRENERDGGAELAPYSVVAASHVHVYRLPLHALFDHVQRKYDEVIDGIQSVVDRIDVPDEEILRQLKRKREWMEYRRDPLTQPLPEFVADDEAARQALRFGTRYGVTSTADGFLFGATRDSINEAEVERRVKKEAAMIKDSRRRGNVPEHAPLVHALQHRYGGKKVFDSELFNYMYYDWVLDNAYKNKTAEEENERKKSLSAPDDDDDDDDDDMKGEEDVHHGAASPSRRATLTRKEREVMNPHMKKALIEDDALLLAHDHTPSRLYFPNAVARKKEKNKMMKEKERRRRMKHKKLSRANVYTQSAPVLPTVQTTRLSAFGGGRRDRRSERSQTSLGGKRVDTADTTKTKKKKVSIQRVAKRLNSRLSEILW